jgi:hypothetical protein
MRIAFLCSGLEPGRDGVGDFARALARAGTELGHDARLAAVRDPLLNDAASATASGEARFHDVFSAPDEARALAAWLRDFAPDWVSVQFTPFGFHPRGLGAKRAASLRALLPPDARRHLMLHEIWLQPGADGAWRHRALGRWQRRSVDAWTGAGFSPALLHTQSRLHQARLRARGAQVELLPLCNTFALTDTPPPACRTALRAWANARGIGFPAGHEDSLWLGHFGAFHDHGWDFIRFANEITSLAAPSGRRVLFLALGRARAASAAWAQAARAVPAAAFHVVGEIPPALVSSALHACDAAFTSTPWDIIEKSSAVAAWRAAGVPVLVTRKGATRADQLPPWPDPGLFLADGASFALPEPGRRLPGPEFLRPDHAARTLFDALAAASSPTPL